MASGLRGPARRARACPLLSRRRRCPENNMRGFIFATLLLASCAVGGDPAGDSKAGAGLGSDVDSTGSPQVGILARVCAAGATTKGVDVSYYNGKIDWTKVKAAGNEFAFIRISDGTGFHDPQFAANWAGAQS